jgi:hypothetical protein
MSHLELPTRDVTVYWYLGTDDELALGGQEDDDDLGTDIELVAHTNEYTPAGVGGEAMWTNLYVSFRRSNATDLTLRFTPYLDGEADDSIDVVLEGVATPTRHLVEIGLADYYPSAADPQIATALRSTTFSLEIRSVGTVPAGRLIIDGIELEWEPVTEGKEAENASA